MQRRRRLEDDVTLRDSLKRRVDDLAVLVEWAQAGEPVVDDLGKGLDELDTEVSAGETKKMLGGEHDRKNAIVTMAFLRSCSPPSIFLISPACTS